MKTVKKDALVAGKHYEDAAEGISDEYYSMCAFLVKAAIATTALVALYFATVGIIDGAHYILERFVVATCNPFGWS